MRDRFEPGPRPCAGFPARRRLAACALAVLCLLPLRLHAWDALPGDSLIYGPAPDGLHVTDGSYVISVGELQINITNHGLIGSHYSLQTSYSDAPSAQWPAGSGIEHLFSAGLWVGGVCSGEKLVSTGQFERELRPPEGAVGTIYEARNGLIVRPSTYSVYGGERIYGADDGDDDGDDRADEEILNGRDDDGDGLIDEDFAMLGNQMMVCTMSDYMDLALEEYPEHRPLNIDVVQRAFSWETDTLDDCVAFQFDITNAGTEPITDLYVGIFADCDIGSRLNDRAAFDDLAGHVEKMVRLSNGEWEYVSVAYMRDGAPEGRVPGWFGISFMGQSTRFSRMRTFQHYTGLRPYVMGGDPTNDAERYQELSRRTNDDDVPEGRPADYRILVSTGPWGVLMPGSTISVPVVFVVGAGEFQLLENCANAQQSYRGKWFNMDDDWWTGRYGRESLVCLEDFGGVSFDESPLRWMFKDHADASCTGLFGGDIRYLDLDLMPDRRHCIYVNMDNCDECARIMGHQCVPSEFWEFWNCNNWRLPSAQRPGCTGIAGRETRAPWTAEMAPPPPAMRLVPDDGAIHMFWDDLSEHTEDPLHNDADFESYRIWRADNWDRPYGTSMEMGPASSLWQLVAEYDLVNNRYRYLIQGDTVRVDSLQHGNNTGLEPIVYRPNCLDDPVYMGLAEAMQGIVDADVEGRWVSRPTLRDQDGALRPGWEGLLDWEFHPAVMDTFFMVAERVGDLLDIVPKRPVRFYEYTDRNVHNGFLYFYAVTATDHETATDQFGYYITGGGIGGDPSLIFDTVSPGTNAQTHDGRDRDGMRIYVYPNPATREALDEFQHMHPDDDDPTGVRVVFTNLPAAVNTVRIFTLDGDLVQTLRHDGSSGFGDVSWNLVSRNGQEVASGVYLYSVRSEDGRFEDFIGKFVIVR